MKRILILAVLGLLLCSTVSAIQDGGGKSTKNPKPTPKAPSVPKPKVEPHKRSSAPAPAGEVTSPSGLRYLDKVVGTGESPRPGQNVTVHYTGMLANGATFDSSVDRGQPYTFQIGVGRVIKGWDEGIITMKVGGKRRLIIPPHLGYGAAGTPPKIPPGATLIFELELLSVSADSNTPVTNPPPTHSAAIRERSTRGAPFHFNTWSYGPGGGQGVDIQFISCEIQPDRITLSFSVRSGDHKDLLLYAPRNVEEGALGSNCEALYVLDDNGQKFYSTSGWRGGRQARFNSCTTEIKFDPNEEVILTADFPMVSRGATAIKFVSPNPDNAGHQSEWYWQGISLRPVSATPSGASSTAPTNVNARWLDGDWEGAAYQINTRTTWTIRLTVQNNAYSVEYPSLSCGGEWVLVDKGLSRAKFKEKITYGVDRCVNDGAITIERISDTQAAFKYSEPNSTVVMASSILLRK